MKLPSLKKRLIFSLAFAPTVDELKDQEVFLVTASGMIQGVPVNTEELGLLAQLADTIAKEHVKDCALEPDAYLPGNDGYIVLRDARVKEGTNTYNFAELIVFFDQIIGISLGKATEKD